jgi:hypothetical protein
MPGECSARHDRLHSTRHACGLALDRLETPRRWTAFWRTHPVALLRRYNAATVARDVAVAVRTE